MIVGGGIAATFAAIKAKKSGAGVTIVDKGTVGRSGLSPFFGGYSIFKESSSLTRDQYVESVSEAGKYINRRDYLDMFMDDSADIADEFLSWGVGVDLSKEGGHGSKYRGQILKNGIRLIERTMITELFKKDGKVAGAIGFPMEGDRAFIIKAKAVVLCSGSGALKTPGFPCSSITHDGDAMAYRIGAEITGKEFNTFHWTHWENPADAYGNWKSILFEAIRPSAYRPGGHAMSATVISRQVHNGDVPFMMEEVDFAPPGTGTPGLPFIWGSAAGMSAHKCEGIFPKGTKCASSIPGLFAAGDALFTGGAAYSGGPGASSSLSAVQGARAGRYAAEYAKENR